ncbi:hypothetical protein KOR42_48060 [Thalassoglobus neptunius]|uniref:Helix-turn-helix domain protein n=1 Tax=Thalassoglobus neptunius TaxID=1938619 RepID=A0A5C5VTK6_9PLAN|nr:hypothetical protein KOR42_48060 [Thalassoglobus neptunius]
MQLPTIQPELRALLNLTGPVLLDEYGAAVLLSMNVRRFRQLLASDQSLPRIELANGQLRFSKVSLLTWVTEQETKHTEIRL